MHINIILSAIQFKGDKDIFLGQPVKNFKTEYKLDDEPPYVFIPGGSDAIKVNHDEWVITYPDGTVEIWSTSEVDCFPNDLVKEIPVEATIPPIV